MKNPFSRNISKAFLYSIVALLICSTISLVALKRAGDKEKWVQHTHFVIQRLQLLLSVLKDAETGARGFIITKQANTLEPYNHAEVAAQKVLDEIRVLTRDNRRQQETIVHMSSNITSQFEILKGYVNATKHAETITAQQIEQGKQTMDEARRIVKLMEDREYHLLQQRNEAWHDTWGYIPFLIGLLTIASVISTTYFCRNLQANYFEKVKFRRLLQQKSIITRNRIHIIQSVTAQVAAGNYALRITGQEKDILGVLSDDINHMTSALDLSFRSLKEWMKKKDEFIDITVHEFRTPLTSIKAALQFIARLKLTGEESKKIGPFVERANNQVKRLTGILKDLVDVTKINSNKLELRPAAFPIREAISESVSEVKAVAVDTKFEIGGNFDTVVHADRLKVIQVATNLLTNAVKYSPAGGQININITNEAEWTRVTVKDYGKGIPAEKLPHIFDRYFRVEETSQNYSGMGLGLYIAKGIVEQHGGQIGVHSIVGQGTAVWFTLPTVSSNEAYDVAL